MISTSSPEELHGVMSVEQVAKYLGVCRATAYNWCKTGGLPSFKVRNTRRIRRDALEAWIGNRESNTAQ